MNFVLQQRGNDLIIVMKDNYLLPNRVGMFINLLQLVSVAKLSGILMELFFSAVLKGTDKSCHPRDSKPLNVSLSRLITNHVFCCLTWSSFISSAPNSSLSKTQS